VICQQKLRRSSHNWHCATDNDTQQNSLKAVSYAIDRVEDEQDYAWSADCKTAANGLPYRIAGPIPRPNNFIGASVMDAQYDPSPIPVQAFYAYDDNIVPGSIYIKTIASGSACPTVDNKVVVILFYY
jgi:hypothetical protein